MSIAELSVKRHVLAIMLSCAIMLFGLISYKRIGVDRFPSIDFPMISVTTILAGANPEVIDSSVTNILESSLNSVPGIDHIQSSSLPGISIITLRFNLKKNVDIAFNEVQAKISQVLNDLPKDAKSPIVTKVDFGAVPILWLVLHGDRTLQQLNQYADNTIKKRLETIDGVGEVKIGGKRERTIRVELDLSRMAAYEITTNDLFQAFIQQHIQLPGGYIVGRDEERLLKLDVEYHDVDRLKQLIVGYRNNTPIRLSEISDVVDGLADFRELARFNQQPSVAIGIVKVSNSNTVAIVKNIKQRLEQEIIPNLPAGISLDIATDDASIIEEIVDALKDHIFEGTLLAAFVVWLFLRNMVATLIVATAIPVSLFGAVAALYFLGYTFNIMTLLGLLLLIGVVVDDAIVVLENIYRWRQEEKTDLTESAIRGTNQVFFAVFASSLTLISMFGAVIFMGGIIGMFIQPFAVVVTVGVLSSLFVSVTLTPMLCSKYLTAHASKSKISQGLERFFIGMEQYYTIILGAVLKHRWKTLFSALLVVLSTFIFMSHLGGDFMPDEDDGRLLVICKSPLGSNIHYMDEKLQQVETRLLKFPEVHSILATIGTGAVSQVNEAVLTVKLVNRNERKLRQSQVLVKIRDELASIPGLEVFASPVPIVGGQRGEPLQFVLQGPNLSKVAELSDQLFDILSKSDYLESIDKDLKLNLPQVEVKVDKIKAVDVGLSANAIAATLNILAGGLDIAKYNDASGDGNRYEIRLKARDGEIQTVEDLSKIFIKTPSGRLVRIDSLVELNENIGPAAIGRYDLQYSSFFFATPKVSLGEAIIKVKEAAANILPPDYHLSMAGRAEELQKTVGYILFAFVTGIILVYMVLASQFNSLIQPFIIMLALPLAIVGGVMGLWLAGHTLNIYSMIGLVLLVGLVAKNSILLIDLTNNLMKEGLRVDEALLKACPTRMRPVLMTSLTVILALFPAALGLGAGADSNGPLAVAVIGGMFSSTLLTLVVIPPAFSLVERRKKRG